MRSDDLRSRGSVGERPLHTRKVAGSIPAGTTRWKRYCRWSCNKRAIASHFWTHSGGVLVVEWLAIGLSSIAIIISVVAYRSSLPRLKVSADGSVMLLGLPTLRGAVQVRVDNNGGASALVRRVSLRSVDSNVFASPDRTLPNPELPFAVDAHGGVAVWNFDHRQLQRDVDVTFREKPLAVRAEIEVGSKRYRQRGRVWVNVPGRCGTSQCIRDSESTRPSRSNARKRPRPQRLQSGWRTCDSEATCAPKNTDNRTTVCCTDLKACVAHGGAYEVRDEMVT